MDIARLNKYKAFFLSMLISIWCTIPAAYWIFHNNGWLRKIGNNIMFMILSGFIAKMVTDQLGIADELNQ